MKQTNNSILGWALLGALVAGQAVAADIRYMNSGDYLDPAGWQGGVIPGTNDTARFNWGNNTVTLSGVAPLLKSFQMGVDESGQLVVNAGGKLNTTGVANSSVGNNSNAGIVGRLTVNPGGEVNVTNVLFVGASATGIFTNNGGNVTVSSHLWVGSAAAGVGSIYITNGGVLTIGGNIGLGTINASTASGGKGSVYVQDGGVLRLSQISGGGSIQANSVLDLSGSGVVILPNDYTAVISAYTNVSKITAYGGSGWVGIDYNHTNVGKTTLFAIAPVAPPPTETVWNPAANPSGSGLWNESANWTGGQTPASVTKVTFNVAGAIPCTVTNTAQADYVIMGDSGPGGKLIIANGGSLAPTSTQNASAIGYTDTATMEVEAGATVAFGAPLWIGLNPGADGTLIMNGGTVSVSGMFGLGYYGGKGTALIKGGTLSLAQWDYFSSILGDSVLDISGTGKVVIQGNWQDSINYFISLGQITNSTGAGLIVDYNVINVGKTTIYPANLVLPPAQVTWDPSLNPTDTRGLWDVSTNWVGGLTPGNVTVVRFSVVDALPCTVATTAVAKQLVMGVNGGPGGTLDVTNGGTLTVSSDDWSAVGYSSNATLVVENGGTASFGNHLWIGFNAGAEGTLVMNGGTLSVGAMFGMGWGGGKGTALIKGGTLNLAQWSAANPGSIAGASLLDVSGTGKVIINGDQSSSISSYISAGKITANGGPNVFYGYDAAANKTTISAVPLPAPRQSITTVSVNNGNVSITYATTAQHTYHLESTPSLAPAVWTPVTGSTNVATGASVTFTLPGGAGQKFYRTVSP